LQLALSSKNVIVKIKRQKINFKQIAKRIKKKAQLFKKVGLFKPQSLDIRN